MTTLTPIAEPGCVWLMYFDAMASRFSAPTERQTGSLLIARGAAFFVMKKAGQVAGVVFDRTIKVRPEQDAQRLGFEIAADMPEALEKMAQLDNYKHFAQLDQYSQTTKVRPGFTLLDDRYPEAECTLTGEELGPFLAGTAFDYSSQAAIEADIYFEEPRQLAEFLRATLAEKQAQVQAAHAADSGRLAKQFGALGLHDLAADYQARADQKKGQ